MHLIEIGERDLSNEEIKQLMTLTAQTNDYEIHIAGNNFMLAEVLIRIGISPDKILMVNPAPKILFDNMRSSSASADVRFQCNAILTHSMIAHDDSSFHSQTVEYKGSRFLVNDDYVRYGALALIAEEINKNGIEGALAELGVFQGTFAALLNKIFPERKLYLFDTFDGFDNRDILTEREIFPDGYTNLAKVQVTRPRAFCETSVGFVLRKMTNPDNCISRRVSSRKPRRTKTLVSRWSPLIATSTRRL